jgi:Ca-activated chloride channel family protein
MIRRAIASLQAGGSTAGASGLRLAYEQARRSYIDGGINRILLATDGDFNVGVTDIDQLKEIVATERKAGIGLSTLGVGHASYNDALMEQIADVGDGKYSFLDTAAEGRKVLVDEFTSTLATVARDVKLQVEFNPAVVKEYRLIGYDNRQLAREDFNNDKVDAGDVGAGHRVTALYEVTLHGQRGLHDEERYPANRPAVQAGGRDDELGFLKIRYKLPDDNRSRLIEQALSKEPVSMAQASMDFRFATAVAAYGQLLQGSPYLRDFGWPEVLAMAERSLGRDPHGQRREFIELAQRAAQLARGENGAPVAISR